MDSITYDPLDLGQSRAVPCSVYLPMLEIGDHTLEKLTVTEKGRQQFIPTPALKKQDGKKVKSRHMLALKRFTLFLGESLAQIDPMQHTSVTDLPLAGRLVLTAHTNASTWQHADGRAQTQMWVWTHSADDRQEEHEVFFEENPETIETETTRKGLYERQVEMGAFGVDCTNRARRKKYQTPLEFRKKVTENDTLLKKFKAYLKNSKPKGRRGKGTKRRRSEDNESTAAAADE